MMLGGHAVARCLRNEGVKHVFSVPGESYIAVVDGLWNIPEIKLITNRQEGCAAFMAEGYAKSTRTVGVCIVTRGPGATNASIAIHSAKYDSVPMVLLVGQVGRGARGREAGQEMDYTHFFGSIAKWVVEINDPKHIPRVMTRAFHIARTGRPGPVVVSLPRDVIEDKADIAMIDPYPTAQPSPDPKLIEETIGRINAAKKPILLVGSGTQYAGAWQELIDFSERFHIPVLTSYKRQDAFPNSHPNYVGNLSNANKAARDLAANAADLIVVLGCRLNQQTTSAFSFPRAGQPFIQIDADEQNIGQNARPEVSIVADARQALLEALKHPGPRPNESRASWIAEQHAGQKRYCVPSERPTRRVSMEHHHDGCRELRPMAAALYRVRATQLVYFPDAWLHGARRSVRGCGQACPSASAGYFSRRRRRLSHDRAGVGNREAVRRQRHHHRLQQRRLQFDSHASRSDVSRPLLWHGAGKSGFGRTRRCLWRVGTQGHSR
jgi:acetolactate synthase-1/2/3 large subunit